MYFQAFDIGGLSAIRFINKCSKYDTDFDGNDKIKNTVRKKMLQQVRSYHSLEQFCTDGKKEVQSAMFHATTKSTAANVVIGIREASGIKNN